MSERKRKLARQSVEMGDVRQSGVPTSDRKDSLQPYVLERRMSLSGVDKKDKSDRSLFSYTVKNVNPVSERN